METSNVISSERLIPAIDPNKDGRQTRVLPALTLPVAVVVVAAVAETISFTVDVFETDFRSHCRL